MTHINTTFYVMILSFYWICASSWTITKNHNVYW